MENKKITLLEKLNIIQHKLKVNKNNFNYKGNYKYRNSEDILEALKPFLENLSLVITLVDEVELIGERYYLKATATLHDTDTREQISTQALAREDTIRNGLMDSPQVTGSASSYARKYALNGLLAIDDTKDADYSNNEGNKDNNNYSYSYANKEKKASFDRSKMPEYIRYYLKNEPEKEKKVLEFYKVDKLEDLKEEDMDKVYKSAKTSYHKNKKAK